MGKIIGEQTSFVAGVSFSEKEGLPNSYAFGRSVDHRSDPKKVDVNVRSLKDSGSTVVDLPMWGARAGNRTFVQGNAGNIYQEDSGWTKPHTAASSSGNGLAYFSSDLALYYGQDKTFGRLLDAATASTYYDDFLSSEGGAPTNTNSLDLEASSSMYASRADTASTSITLDLTLEAYIKPESLPSTGNTMTLISKWDTNSDERSYKMDIVTVSNFFGSGTDGALVISTNTTEAPIDSACSGTAASYSLTATNASFAADQKIMIHQTRGTNSGTTQYTTIQSYTAGTITTTDPLDISFATSGDNAAQVRVLKQYTNVTVNTGCTYTAKAWDGTVGGILAFYANGTLTVTGGITASEKGFRGGQSSEPNVAFLPRTGWTGEGSGGATVDGANAPTTGIQISPANNTTHSGGGAGRGSRSTDMASGGGGGGHATVGTDGKPCIYNTPNYVGGVAGIAVGDANLTSPQFGGGGGGGGFGKDRSTVDLFGGDGGGILGLFAKTITGTGSITNNGGVGSNGGEGDASGAGGGAGGSTLFNCQTLDLTSLTVTATGGAGGVTPYATYAPDGYNNEERPGGAGAVGRIAANYLTSVTGTTSPTITTNQDNELGSTDGYGIRLQVSSDGTAVESYIQEVSTDIAVGDWGRWQVTWDASASTAEFFKNAVSLGEKTGAVTSIYNSTAVFGIGADFGVASAAQNFFDGLIDDVRVWNDIRTDSELSTWNNRILVGTEANLIAYYKFDGDVTDSQTDGLNDLTAYNTPTYSSDIPFFGLTTRKDEDQRNEQTGQTYTLAVAIAETATHRQTFIPAKDPQESIEVDIAAKGTGNWTITVHDSLNRLVTSKTVLNADLNIGFYEFIFASTWRPIIGASYHFHLTSTVADGTVVTGTTVDLETVRFRTHYQFLVEDQYHPMAQHLDFLVIGNERYLAKFEAGDLYEPHQLTFPSGYRVRALASWREFIAIGCWKGTSITDYDEGRIFFWDGISDTYNHSISVPEGGVNAMFGTQDVLFIVAGYTGEILVYNGGGAAQKFHKIPKVTRDKYIEVAPGSMNMWRTNIHMGVGLNTDSEAVEKGVYSVGTAQREYPVSLGFDYPTSLGEQTGSDTKISMVFPSGHDLYVGWQKQNSYGIDKISVDNDSYPDATLEMLITDLGSISDDDFPMKLRADFEPLEAGESIRIKYKADRETSWKVFDYEATEGAMQISEPIKERMKEIQVAVDWLSTIGTQATLLGITLEVEKEQSGGRRT